MLINHRPRFIPEPEQPHFARLICARKVGVGADGLILIEDSPRADFKWRFYNADGSEAEMCGNGIRCLAKHIRDRHGVPVGPFVVETDAGPVRCRITAEGEGISRVEVELPAPQFEPAAVPVVLPEGAREVVRESNGRPVRFTPLLIGNPHAVTFDVEGAAERAVLGPALESDAAFPQRTNVEFARMVGDGEIRLDVFERACGFTKACGSGAAAAVVAACATGRVPWGRMVLVTLPGGALQITAPGPDKPVLMEGPARRVYEGTFVARHLVPGSRG